MNVGDMSGEKSIKEDSYVISHQLILVAFIVLVAMQNAICYFRLLFICKNSRCNYG